MDNNDKTVKFAVVGLGNIGSRHLAVIDAEPRARLVDIPVDHEVPVQFGAKT